MRKLLICSLTAVCDESRSDELCTGVKIFHNSLFTLSKAFILKQTTMRVLRPNGLNIFRVHPPVGKERMS